MYSCQMLELNALQEFSQTHDTDFFQALPESPGVLLLDMKETFAQPYLARTSNIRGATERLLGITENPTKRLNLRALARGIRYRTSGSKFEQMVVHYQQARIHFPGQYRELVRLRPPAILKVNLRNSYPRCYITRRIASDQGFYFGPFPSRKAAETFGEEFLDLFKIRRCQIKIRPDPRFPGCIYSEMKMCLAPCFAGCTKQEYEAEVNWVIKTLATAGLALTRDVERQREAASEALDFERAAILHRRLEKISAALRGLPALTKRLEDLNAVIIQRGAEEKTVVAFPIRGGMLTEPIIVRFRELSSEPRSVEAILRAGLEPQLTGLLGKPMESHNFSTTPGHSTQNQTEEPSENQMLPFGLHAGPAEVSEHLSLIARWFYSNPREGEILFRDQEWPYRRILRSCARLLAPTTDTNSLNSPITSQVARASRDRIKRLKAFSQKHRSPPR